MLPRCEQPLLVSQCARPSVLPHQVVFTAVCRLVCAACCLFWGPAAISVTAPLCRPAPRARSIANRYAAAPGFASAQVRPSCSPPPGSSSSAAATLPAGASVSFCLIQASQHLLSWSHDRPTGLSVSPQDTCNVISGCVLIWDSMCTANHLNCGLYSD